METIKNKYALNYEGIKDRYGNPLKEAEEKPTLQQSIYSWALINELFELGYCHNWQSERSDIADYIYEESKIIDKALRIIQEGSKADDEKK